MFSSPIFHLNYAQPICAIAILSITLSGCDKSSQKKGIPVPSSPAATTPLPPSDHAGKIGPGDILAIRFLDLQANNSDSIRPVHVAADGTISLPEWSPMKIAGMTPSAAAKAITDAYRNANIEDTRVGYVRRWVVASDAGSPFGVIGNFDLVRIEIDNIRAPGVGMVNIGRVEPDGAIGIPYLGSVKIAGLTEGKAEQAIADGYRKANIMQNAQVLVFVLEIAPVDAAVRDLPDTPLRPYPPVMTPLFEEKPMDDIELPPAKPMN